MVYLEVPTGWVGGQVVNQEEGMSYIMLDRRSTNNLGKGTFLSQIKKVLILEWGENGVQ